LPLENYGVRFSKGDGGKRREHGAESIGQRLRAEGRAQKRRAEGPSQIFLWNLTSRACGVNMVQGVRRLVSHESVWNGFFMVTP